MSLRTRPFSGLSDLEKILDLLLTCQSAGYADTEFRSIELRIMFANPTFDARRLTLIFDDDSPLLAAFAVLWQGRYLGMLVRPDQRGRLEERILEWAAEQVLAGPQSGNEHPELSILCRDDDVLSRSLYEGYGFSLEELELRMVRNLSEPIPEPEFPEGFMLRSLDPATELDDWLQFDREMFGHAPHQLERWRRARADMDYDRALDLVAVDGDGKLAAMCYCSIPSFETTRGSVKEGRTEPIAVAAPHRRKGLGRAMVLCGLHLLKSRGMDRVLLTTAPDNAPAQRLYESLGYRLLYNASWYSKAL